MHILQRIDYTFQRDGQEGTFTRIFVTASPEPTGPTTFRDTIEHLAHLIESVLSEGAQFPTPDGDICTIHTLVKTPVYKEGFSEIEGGFQYNGEYTLGAGAKTAQRLVNAFTRVAGHTARWSLNLSGKVRRWGNGSVDTDVSLLMFADPVINLALLDRILADSQFVVAPRAQEALTRIAALRAGQQSTDPNEWVALLQSSGSEALR